MNEDDKVRHFEWQERFFAQRVLPQADEIIAALEKYVRELCEGRDA